MSAVEYLAKAQRAAAGARTLAASGDAEGTINRAYYAMFDAALAMLLYDNPKMGMAKTHSSVLRLFGRAVIARGLDPSLGRVLRLAEKSRLAADYAAEPAAMEEAHAVLKDMESMLQAIETLFAGGDS